MRGRTASRVVYFLAAFVSASSKPLACFPASELEQHTLLSTISKIQPLDIELGVNNVVFWGMQLKPSKNLNHASVNKTLFNESAIIIRSSNGFNARDGEVYLAVTSGSAHYDVVINPQQPALFLQSRVEGALPAETVAFFNALWDGHLQTFAVDVGAGLPSDVQLPGKPATGRGSIVVFYFVPEQYDKNNKVVEGPKFQKLQEYSTSYDCSDSNLILYREFSIDLGDTGSC